MDGTGECEGNPNPNSSLTEDLLIEILLWLPVVSLLRFKAVCKYWRSIIESSEFIHRHATFEESTSKFGNFIFQYRPRHIVHWDYKPYFFVLSSSRSSSSCGDGEEEDYGRWSYKNLGLSPHLSDDDEYHVLAERYPMQANMVGSCHGIICIHDPVPRDIILWNPATKKFRCLPKSLPLLDELRAEFVFFGFDCETNDYKVLQITSFEIKNETDTTRRNMIQIYSLRSDSWRLCVDANLYSHYYCAYKSNIENQGRYLNGSYYFKGKSSRGIERIKNFNDLETVVLSFNFSRESFKMIPIPDNNNNKTSWLDVIGGDQGKIVYITFSSDGTSDVYKVHTLNADNKECSWSKLHMFTVNHASGRIDPKAITKNGVCGFLCRDGGCLRFINFLTAEMKYVDIIGTSMEGLGQALRADVYKESLVSVDSAVPGSSSSSSC